jgi:uncharacterized protein (DUF305 family)
MSGHDMGTSSSPAGGPSASIGASPASGAHNDADVTFAQMMIPHHQQAVMMSEMLLVKDGIDAKVTDLATRIKGAQAPEIAQLGGWLAGWSANPSSSSMGGMDHGGGMMSQSELDALDLATGDDAAQLFLTGIVKHHEGAVAMAQTALAQGQNPEAKKVAQAIISAQKAEITDMTQLLGR